MQTSVEIERDGTVLRGVRHIPQGDVRPLPAAVILHGFTADKLGPHKILRSMSLALEEAGIASFRFDLAGSGESDGRFQDVTVSTEVADGHAILDAVCQDKDIDPSRVALVGHSMGGLVASIVAGERPSHVARLALLAPAGNIREFAFGLAQQAGISPETALSSTRETFEWEGFLVGRAFALDLMGLEPFGRALPYRGHGDVLLVNGSEDATVPPAVARRYQAEVYGEHSKLQVIEGADHTFTRHVWETEAIATVRNFLQPLSDRVTRSGGLDGAAAGEVLKRGQSGDLQSPGTAHAHPGADT